MESMNFAYSADGLTVRLNQSGTGDELTGVCTPSQRKWGMNNEYYNAPDGVLTPKSQEEVDAIRLQSEKDSALVTMIANIESKMAEENLKQFPYNGEIYKSDQSNIQSTQNQCLSMDGVEPIPTMLGTQYDGMWPAESGFVAFTASEFITFATSYFIRGSNNFTTRSGHIVGVTDIYNDENKTAQDILDYDYSGGWF